MAWGLGGLVGLISLALAVLLLFLHTDFGARKLAELATGQAREALLGQLAVGRVEVRGALTVCARDVELRDPDGNLALTAAEACVGLQLPALLRKEARIRTLRLVRPVVDLAALPAKEGLPASNTLARALQQRHPSAPGPDTGPTPWKVELAELDLLHGSVTIRPAPGAAPSFALEGVSIDHGHARYSAQSAAALLSLGGQLTAPGALPVALSLDAQLDPPEAKGNATLRALRVKLGESGFAAQGSFELGARKGELALRELRVRPQDLDALLPPAKEAGRQVSGPLAGEVRGEAKLSSDGDRATLALNLEAGGGTLRALASSSLAAPQSWSLELAAEGVDPGAVASASPHGKVSFKVAAHGKGIPTVDKEGVKGELQGKVHVGPAQLERMGPIVADLEANLLGRYAIVRAFTAAALGLQIKAHGAAARDELSLDLEVQAPKLVQVGRAVGTLTRQPAPPLAGSAQLQARVTGSPQAPDAQIHLRAPRLDYGAGLHLVELAVDGVLQGKLSQPDGSLSISARSLNLGQIDLGAPRLAVDLAWPVAHLRVDAGVASARGRRADRPEDRLQVAGDARVDEDRDGLLLSNILVAWPGNTLHLAHPTRLHLRPDETRLEPLELSGEHGSLSLAATLHPAQRSRPARVEAQLAVTRLELSRLPAFALPPELHLAGLVSATVVARGALPAPDVELSLELKGVDAERFHGIDARLQARLHKGRVNASGTGTGPAGVQLSLRADLPAGNLAAQPASAPIELQLILRGIELAKLADLLQNPALTRQAPRGEVEVRLLAEGTVGAPKATLSLDGRNLGSAQVKNAELRAGLLLDKGRAALDGTLLLGGASALGLTASQPFDLAHALRDPAYLKEVLDRPGLAELEFSSLRLEQLVSAGLLPAGSQGVVRASLKLSGTPAAPLLSFIASGDKIEVGRVRDLAFQAELGIDKNVHLKLGLQPGDAAQIKLEAGAQVSAEELIALLRGKGDRALLEPLFDRAVSLQLDVPELIVGRVAALAGRAELPAEGVLRGNIKLSGTPNAPQLLGQMDVRQIVSGDKKLGNADIYVEATNQGGLFHLGISPPRLQATAATIQAAASATKKEPPKPGAPAPPQSSGGSLLGHAQLTADLGARALLENGKAGLLEGQLSGRLTAKQLDLSFLSGLVPSLRRTLGTLDADVKLDGLLGHPSTEGEAHLRHGLVDVVGQGVFEDLGLDATFSPREIVLDRLTGSTGGGHFSAVVVTSFKPKDEQEPGDRLEFTGEVHLGDAEAVRDRIDARGQPLQARAVPFRQAGEERVDVTGEVDLFGEYAGGTVTATVKIPDARAHIRALPDKRLPALEPNPEILLVRPGEKPHPPGIDPKDLEKEVQARKTANLRVDLHLQLDSLYVSAEDFEFKVRSDLHLAWDAQRPDEPTADGAIEVPNGSFSALGRRFEIEDAKITETGGEIADPELEIKARYENPQATVTINVSGSASDPQIDLSSNPPMDQDAIAFFLATGRVQGRATQQGGGVDLSSAATSVVGGLLFGQLRKSLADVLPVDVITIETGSGGGVAQASVGKYIGDRIFIGYRQRLTPAPGENTSEGRVEYQFSRAVSAEATVGERNSDLSVLFTKDF